MAIPIAGEWITTGQTAEFGSIEFRSPDLIMKGESVASSTSNDCDNNGYSHYYYGGSSSNSVWVDIPGGFTAGGVGIVVEPPNNHNRKEKTNMVQRQTFLDALTDEGASVDSEGRDVVKEANADKWELFIARLLARAFKPGDLAVLKEKPKEVLVKEA